MTNLSKAIQYLYPTLNFADVDGTLANIRYDNPLPENFIPPTQEQIDKALLKLTVPETAVAGDFMRALLDLGWYDSVVAAIDSLRNNNTAQGKLVGVLWDRASSFERYNPLLIMIATAIGKNSDDLDQLFIKTLEYRA
jgi:hypothetical protein